MNSEQLNSARLARWSQNGEARLTQEAATEWLNTIGFCPYLPLGTIPSASFVEAVVGRPASTPSAGERSRSNELLVRLVENALAVPLKLGATLTEQPDFVAGPEAFRYIYALRGNRNFKGAPSTVGNDKVTPLALHCWEAIIENGPLDVAALQPILGRDMTEAAIARSLHELWTALYVFPTVSATGQPAKWDLLYRHFPQQIAAGSSTGHAEALSAMVSLYLHAVVAAAEEEILSFLSPFAPQSKLREVIRGLGSMRQLDIIDIAGRSHVCLQGGLLPEMVTQLSEEQLATSSVDSGIEIERAPQPRFSDTRSEDGSGRSERFVPKKFVPKKFVPRDSRSAKFPSRRFDQPGAGSEPGTSRPPRFTQKRSPNDGPRRFDKFGSRDKNAQSFDKRGPATHGAGERAKRWEKSGERIDRRPASGRDFRSKSISGSSGFQRAGSKPPDRKRFAEKPTRFRSDSKPAASKPWSDQGGRYKDPSAGSGRPRPPFRSKETTQSDGVDKERRDHWKKKSDFGSKPPNRKRFTEKPTGFKSADSKPAGSKPWVSKGAKSRVGSAKSYAARTGGKPSGAKPWMKRESSEQSGTSGKPRPREKDESRTDERPSGKSAAKPFWARNPRGGKGSVASSRTNRPRGGKAGKKKR